MKRCCLLLFLTLSPLAGAAGLDVYFVDTEGGAATLIVSPKGESILVDTGNPGGRDAGRIKDCAVAAGLKQIDHLVTTHYHIDHFGGAAELAGMFPVKTVWDNGRFEGQTEKPSEKYQLFTCDARKVLNPGDALPLQQADGAPALSIRCIGTRQQFIPPPAGATPAAVENPKRKGLDKSDNANSIVLLLSYGDFQFFMGGDLTWNIEEKMVNPVNLVGAVDVYLVTHHGLDVSNNPLVLQALQPTVAVMMNGKTKGCGPETCATLKATPSIQAIFQTHKNTRKDSENNTADTFIANIEPGQTGNLIQLSVAADAKNYAVKIPAKKYEKSFATK